MPCRQTPAHAVGCTAQPAGRRTRLSGAGPGAGWVLQWQIWVLGFCFYLVQTTFFSVRPNPNPYRAARPRAWRARPRAPPSALTLARARRRAPSRWPAPAARSSSGRP